MMNKSGQGGIADTLTIKTSFSFAKNSLNSCLRPRCKSHGHPGVEEVQIRVCAKLFRGCGDVYLPC